MSKVKCEMCGKLFDRDKVVEKFDEEYGLWIYDYQFSRNDFCYKCAVYLIENEDEDYDEDNPPPGCRECGGEYPLCCDSCPLFDD